MLTPIPSPTVQAGEARFAIVASRYNAQYVDAMVRAAEAELRRAGARQVMVIRVPGAYEVPIVAARLARSASSVLPWVSDSTPDARPAAILCLGLILRGETTHAAHIGEAVSRALMDIQLQYLVPVIHEVLLLENEDQARVRCLGLEHNRGTEAAQTALAMAQIMTQVSWDVR